MNQSATRPQITTERLLLRRFTAADAPEVSRLCDNYNMYKSTLNLPHPYPLESALEWIATHEESFASGQLYEFAITGRETGHIYGAVGLSHQQTHKHGEIGYWIGEEYWGQGYATEAVKAVLDFAFREKDIHRVYARFFASNPASGKVMEKCGMTYEGTQKDHIYKEGRYEDLLLYGILNPNHQ
ncbi:GNAT family N-acetyltransferase [Bhargavaea ginsengi]|uniref:GNAT family N-acetyltransferase n=1 Tax=Bhargavaea ginsengi TaxID=426757 RepID=UPI00203EA5CB|nr:GNAT family N-acetyltransferase [Bhargavaea ginsengi]MCM3088606.1 GNAT family N-acetyltransferase [Bhargavaea ginsengi]